MANIKFGDIQISGMPGIAVDGVNLDVGGILSQATTFAPASFAKSDVVDIVTRLFLANKAREGREQQVALLNGIRDLLQELNRKAQQILEALDRLPSIIQAIVRDEVLWGRLDGYHGHFDAIALQFLTKKDFRITPDTWADLNFQFFEIGEHENRFSKLVRLLWYTELMNFISAGKEHAYFAVILRRAADRLEALQRRLAEVIVGRYINAIQNLVRVYETFAARPIDWGRFAGPHHFTNMGLVLYVDSPKGRLIFGSGNQGLGDVTFEFPPVSMEQLQAQQRAGGFNHANGKNSAQLAEFCKYAPGNEPDGYQMPSECNFYWHLPELYSAAYFAARERVTAQVGAFKNEMAELEQLIIRFREIQELKNQLRAAAGHAYEGQVVSAMLYTKMR